MSRTVDFLYKIASKRGLVTQLHSKILDENPELDSNPVNHIFQLEDSSDKLYLWDLDCTDEQCMELAQSIKKKYVKSRNRNPDALHIVRNDVAGLKEMDPGTVREVVGPWLNESGDESNE